MPPQQKAIKDYKGTLKEPIKDSKVIKKRANRRESNSRKGKLKNSGFENLQT